MKLAEALIHRADLNARLAQVRERALRVARVQEGDEPAEDPGALLAEHGRMAEELERTIARINRTNLAVRLGASGGVGGGLTMTDALARRDALRVRGEFLRAMAGAASGTNARVTRSELRTVATVSVREVQAEADRVARELRELEALIQGANWANDLVE